MKLKKLLLSLATIIFSGFAWFFFSRIFKTAHTLQGTGVAWLGFMLSMSVAYAFTFLVALTKDRFDFLLTTLLAVLWIPVFLGISVKTLLCMGALYISTQVLLEFPMALARSLNIKYFTIAYAKLALVALALLGISAAYFQEKLTDNLNPQQFSEQTSVYVWPLLGQYLGEYNSSATVDQYLREQFKEQGVAQPSQQMLAEQRRAIAKQVGFELKGNEKMSDLGKHFVALRLNELLSQYHVEKSGIYVIFLSLLVLWPIVRMIFAFVAWALMWLIRRSGVLHVVEAQVTTQTLEF